MRWWPLFVTPILVMALVSVPATARAQINLAWNDCITQPGQQQNIAYACDGSAIAPFRAVMSFIPPVNLTAFVGMYAYVDIVLSVPQLPDYWRLGVGECRQGGLVFPTSLSGIGTGSTGICRNPWLGADTTGGGFVYTSEYLGVHYSAQVTLAFARDSETSLTAHQQYVAGVFEIHPDVNSESCSGCGVEACLSLNWIELFQTPGATSQDIVTLVGAAQRQIVTWQNTSPFPLCVVPVRKTTWGSVKALYR